MTMKGNFGPYGGQFVPEQVIKALDELETAYEQAIKDESFFEELNYYLKDYVGRESSLYFAEKLTDKLGGAKIYLKREDLNHTGAHKINNTLGQGLLAKRMGKKRVIAETGAGQHGVATATVCALFGLECEIFMGAEDTKRQRLNVIRMKLLGAKVTPVTTGTATLKDAVDAAIMNWAENIEDTFYLLGSAVGPHPYPTIVREFQKIIGIETRRQILEKEGRLPDHVIACVGGGSNAIGIFAGFLEDKNVTLYGVEAAGHGLDTDKHSATITKGSIGIVDGMKTYVLQDDNGKPLPVHSVAPGLDYPGVGPQHSYLYDLGRAKYVSVTDKEAIKAFKLLSEEEGIIPALESSHAVAYAVKLASNTSKDEVIVINLSGRGDKDVETVAEILKIE